MSINGAGWGWYVDPNPSANTDFTATSVANEFTAKVGSTAEGKLDLLTVMIHELGHVLGLGDTSDETEAMDGIIAPGMRRLPSASDIAKLRAQLAANPTGNANGTPVIWQTMTNPAPVSTVVQFKSAQTAATFSNSLNTGWQTAGNVATTPQGTVTLGESGNANAHLSQAFMLNPGDRYLSFTISSQDLQSNGLVDGEEAGPKDAFEVALLNASTGTALVGTDGLSHSDALLNIQTDGTERLANTVRKVMHPDGSATYYIDLQQGINNGATIAATPALLSFDLLGFGAGNSHVSLRDIQLISKPVAFDDTIISNEDQTVLLNPLSNDLFGTPAAVPQLHITSQPAHGSLVVNADGTISYTPAALFYGEDSFQYRYTVASVDTGAGQGAGSDADAAANTSNVATVRLTINHVNHAPTVVSGNLDANVTAGQAYGFDPLFAPVATDVDQDQLSAVIDTPPAHGNLVVNTDGTWTYTADNTYSGEDSLVYHINDGTANSASVTVHFHVQPANTAPVATNASLQLQEDGSITIRLTDYGTDEQHDTLSVRISAQPVHGSLTANADGSYTYVPDPLFHGDDSLRFILNDGQLDSQEATISLQVTHVNHATVVNNRSISLAEDTTAVLNLLSTATDVDGDSLTVHITTQPAHGTLVKNADNTWTYTPAANYNGSDSFAYVVNDGTVDSNVATVTLNVTPVNDAPVLANQSRTLAEDTTAVLNLLSSATDVDGDALTVRITTQPAHGSVVKNADGTWIYTPAANYNGSDSFAYVINDGTVDSNVATVALNVTPVNDAPVLANQSRTLSEDSAAILNLLSTANDVDGDVLTVRITAQPAHGTVSRNADGTWTYTPAANYNGSDSFAYVVNDGAVDSNIAIVSLNVTAVNDAPSLSNQSVSLLEDNATKLNLLTAASDVDGDTLTVRITTQPAHGTIVKNADGTWTYTPATNYNGSDSDSFAYVVNDGAVDSNVATVSINVVAVNDAPVLIGQSISMNSGSSKTINLLANANDVDTDDVLTVRITTQPAHGSVVKNADNTWTYTPVANYSGSDSFAYVVNDGSVDSNLAIVSISIAAVTQSGINADLGIAGKFNVFAFNDFTGTESDVQGAVAVGHNFNVSNYSVNDLNLPYNGLSLIVGNDLTDHNGGINGTASYGHQQDTYGQKIDDQFIQAAPPFSFADVQAQLTTLSTKLASQPVTGTVVLQYGGLTFTGDGTSAVQVFSISGADFASAGYTHLENIQPGQSIIVNIIGDSGFDGGVTDAFDGVNTLFNFSSAQQVSINTGVYGNILAPLASINGGIGVINGNVIVNNWNSGVQINAYHFFTPVTLDNGNTPTPVNHAPVVSNQSITLDNVGSFIIDPLASATDADHDNLSSRLISTAGHGTVTLNTDGSFTYQATAGYVGNDSFSYLVNDGATDSNLATVSLTVTAVAPPALTSADLGLAGQFGAFIFNDFNSSAGEVAGAVAVGHDFAVSAYSIDTTQKNYQGLSLVVGNQLDFHGGSFHGQATYGNSQNTNNLPDSDSIVHAAPPFSFANTQAQLTDLSTSLAALPANGSSTVQYGGITFQGDGSSNAQIFNVAGTDLLDVSYANFINLTPGQTLIINVTGDSGMQGGMPDGFRNYNALFNFSTAQQLTFTNVALNASILAPLATVQGGSGVIDGNVVVNNWNSNIYIANNRSFQAAGLPALAISAQASAIARSVAAANPYATVLSQAMLVDTTDNSTTITATDLQPVSSSSAIVIPAGLMSDNATSTVDTTTADEDSELAMAALLDSLGDSLGSALQAQMDQTLTESGQVK